MGLLLTGICKFFKSCLDASLGKRHAEKRQFAAVVFCRQKTCFVFVIDGDVIVLNNLNFVPPSVRVLTQIDDCAYRKALNLLGTATEN